MHFSKYISTYIKGPALDLDRGRARLFTSFMSLAKGTKGNYWHWKLENGDSLASAALLHYELPNSSFVCCRPANAYVIKYDNERDGTINFES